MAKGRLKITQMTPKGADLDTTDLFEVSVDNGSGHETMSITGQEVIDGIANSGDFMLKSVYDPDNDGIVTAARREMLAVINKTGVTVTKGTIVYLKTSSSSGTHPEILLADADTEATSTKTLGGVYENILDGDVGYVVTSGEVDNLNTSAYNIGDRLWLSQTAGQVTTTPPVQPAHTVFIGIVTRSQNTNGRILYSIQNGYEVNELHDVLITSVANNQALIYESATSLWKNKSLSSIPQEVSIVTYTASLTNLQSSDAYKLVQMNVGSANDLRIPTNAGTPFPIGTQILIMQYGTGQTTIAGTVGVTVRSSGGKNKIAAQYGMATLVKIGTDEWVLSGDLTT